MLSVGRSSFSPTSIRMRAFSAAPPSPLSRRLPTSAPRRLSAVCREAPFLVAEYSPCADRLECFRNVPTLGETCVSCKPQVERFRSPHSLRHPRAIANVGKCATAAPIYTRCPYLTSSWGNGERASRSTSFQTLERVNVTSVAFLQCSRARAVLFGFCLCRK